LENFHGLNKNKPQDTKLNLKERYTKVWFAAFILPFFFFPLFIFTFFPFIFFFEYHVFFHLSNKPYKLPYPRKGLSV
jgi:hypothetical protein